jgi:SWIM/SEC-C metal-binding protein
MGKLGTEGKPAVIRVQTEKKAQEILSLRNSRGWQVIIGLEPDTPEDISDVEKLLNPPKPLVNAIIIGRNAPCPCGSGKKYKHCCMN